MQRPRRSFFVPPKETIRINDNIRVSEVRVVDHDGTPLGILPIGAALDKARERLLDLVEVSPTAAPPVVEAAPVLTSGQTSAFGRIGTPGLLLFALGTALAGSLMRWSGPLSAAAVAAVPKAKELARRGRPRGGRGA